MLKWNDKPWIQLLLGPALLCLAWYVNPLFATLGFVPLLFIEKHYSVLHTPKAGLKLWGMLYAYFFFWNIGVTWWIYNSTLEGAIMAIVANSFLMTLPVMVFRMVKNTIIDKFHGFPFRFILGYAFFPAFWICFEWIHLNWELTWPWLTLGNCFAFMPKVVQWYAYTGVLGGSLWILTVNLLWFRVFNVAFIRNVKLILPLAFTFFPMIVSTIIYAGYHEKGEEVEVVVVQPNIDPYTEKFQGSPKHIPYDLQLERLIALSTSQLSIGTDFLVWPETALPANFDEDQIRYHRYVKRIRTFLKDYPHVTLIAGLDSYKLYLTQFDASPSARLDPTIGYHDYFNTAMCINDYRIIQLYHKSKLVPGVERMPYPQYFKFLEAMAIDMGGITGSLGTQNKRTVFYNSSNQGAAPVICYESIFGAFVAEFVRNGAQMICIITNDGWWGNTPGYKQHFAMARLRAIETRRSLARAANTGISGFINQHGDVMVQSAYGDEAVQRMSIRLNKEMTFYALAGDYLGVVAAWISVLGLLVFGFVASIKRQYVRKLFKLPALMPHARKHSDQGPTTR